MKANELKNIAIKYNLVNIVNKLESLDKEIDVKVGFLGEFSSGKSTLINRLIGKKVLPVMNEPTSKTIVEIEGVDGLENIEYYQYKDGELIKISALDFSEIAVTSTKDVLYLKVPSNEFLKDGYLFIDTPGISSIDKSDTDITFGYLPYLDAAVICQDINFGTISKSLENFLLKPEVKTIINNFIFAITKADLSSNPKKIKDNVIEYLKELNSKHNLGLNNIEKRVVLTSKDDLNEFKNSFKELILDRKELLEKNRKEKILKDISKELLSLLEETKRNANLNLDDILEEEKRIEKEIKELKEHEKAIYNKLDKFEKEMDKLISNILNSNIYGLTKAQNEEEIESIISNIESQIFEQVNNRLNQYFKELETNVIIDNSILNKIKNEVISILKNSEILKKIGTVLLFALILPEGGILGNAVEGGGSLVVREAGKVLAKESTKVILLKTIGEVVKQINPVEIIGDFIASKIVKSKIEKEFNLVSSNLAFLVTKEIESLLSDVFEKNNRELENKKLLLNSLFDKKSKKTEEFFDYVKSLDKDIEHIRKDI